MSSKDVWTLAVGGLLALGLILHAVFPRYEWRTAAEDGSVIIVYDRWANYLQRAVYDDQGRVKPGEPFKPF